MTDMIAGPGARDCRTDSTVTTMAHPPAARPGAVSPGRPLWDGVTVGSEGRCGPFADIKESCLES
eukprot:489078-Hanusia_phi.AAC.1